MLQFYPATAELLHGLGLVLLGRDTLSPAINLMWLGLVLLAAWCIGRPRGLGPTATLGAAVALATPMATLSQAGSADNDIVGVFFLMAAVALLVNSERHRPAQVLAAIAAGLAVAVKLTLVVPVLALTVAWLVLARTQRREHTGAAARWLGPLALAAAFWYLRNLLSVGNPLPWISFGLLPTPAPALQQHTGFAVAHYLTDSRFWSHFFEPGIASQLGQWWWAILATAVAGPLLCLLPGSSRTRRLLGFVALASLVAYLFTPESAQGPAGDPVGFGFNMRYALPGLTLSLTALALAPALAGQRRQTGLAVMLVAVLIATVTRPSLWPASSALAAFGVGAGVALAGVALAGAAIVGRRPSRLSVRRSVVLAGAVTLLAAGSAAGYGWQRHYLHGRYAYRPGISHLARVWAWFRAVHGARVGIVGTYGGFFSYPLFGLDDSNRVQYIAHRGPHGSFTPIGTCREWHAAVNAAHLRYLVTTPGRVFWRPKVLLPSPEDSWTRSDPAARRVLHYQALGQPIAVYELQGPLQLSCG